MGASKYPGGNRSSSDIHSSASVQKGQSYQCQRLPPCIAAPPPPQSGSEGWWALRNSWKCGSSGVGWGGVHKRGKYPLCSWVGTETLQGKCWYTDVFVCRVHSQGTASYNTSSRDESEHLYCRVTPWNATKRILITGPKSCAQKMNSNTECALSLTSCNFRHQFLAVKLNAAEK